MNIFVLGILAWATRPLEDISKYIPVPSHYTPPPEPARRREHKQARPRALVHSSPLAVCVAHRLSLTNAAECSSTWSRSSRAAPSLPPRAADPTRTRASAASSQLSAATPSPTTPLMQVRSPSVKRCGAEYDPRCDETLPSEGRQYRSCFFFHKIRTQYTSKRFMSSAAEIREGTARRGAPERTAEPRRVQPQGRDVRPRPAVHARRAPASRATPRRLGTPDLYHAHTRTHNCNRTLRSSGEEEERAESLGYLGEATRSRSLARAALLAELLALHLVAGAAEGLEGLVDVEHLCDRLTAVVVDVVE